MRALSVPCAHSCSGCAAPSQTDTGQWESWPPPYSLTATAGWRRPNAAPADNAQVSQNAAPADSAQVSQNAAPADSAQVSQDAAPADTAQVRQNAAPADSAQVRQLEAVGRVGKVTSLGTTALEPNGLLPHRMLLIVCRNHAFDHSCLDPRQFRIKITKKNDFL